MDHLRYGISSSNVGNGVPHGGRAQSRSFTIPSWSSPSSFPQSFRRLRSQMQLCWIRAPGFVSRCQHTRINPELPHATQQRRMVGCLMLGHLPGQIHEVCFQELSLGRSTSLRLPPALLGYFFGDEYERNVQRSLQIQPASGSFRDFFGN